MADSYEDERGTIRDLLGAVDGVTIITTKAGHVRGNHSHPSTTQWVYVVQGSLLVKHEGGHEAIYPAGEFFEEPAAIPHAWRAVTDCTVLVFTKGPRSGAAYESDTVRLPKEKFLLGPRLCTACHAGHSPGFPLTVTTAGGPAHLICPKPGS